MLIVEDPTVTVKCRTAIKVLFLYFNLCLSVMLNSLSCPFTSISVLTDYSYISPRNNDQSINQSINHVPGKYRPVVILLFSINIESNFFFDRSLGAGMSCLSNSNS